MKKFVQKYYIVLLLVFLIICIAFCFLFLSSGKDKKKEEIKSDRNKYNFSNQITEVEGTQYYTNDSLQSSHCLEDICIERASFFYNGNNGRVEYTIKNQSNKKASGYLKMVFGNKALYVSYKDLEPGKSVRSVSSYLDVKISNKEDYRLEKLTKDEMRKIKVSN